jgi:hypothetical protein
VITAEAFSFDTIEIQATDMVELVAAQGAWVDEEQPWLRERFASEVLAVNALARSLSLGHHEQRLLRKNNVAIGFGRIMNGQMIGDPSKWSQTLSRKLRGDRLEYWADAAVSDTDHQEITEVMIGQTVTDRVIAVLNQKELERARGIPMVMRAVGKPVDHIFVPLGRYGFGLHWKKGPLQAYYYDKTEHKAASMSS